MRPWFDDHTLWRDKAAPATRVCEHAGCKLAGEHRAPFSPQQTNKYRWFCLEHVRAYNANWDFAKGLAPEEIEQVIRFDTIWQRETRPLGDWRTKERLLRAKARFFGFEDSPKAGPRTQAPTQDPKLVAALAVLELDVLPPKADLQAKYRILVKLHHPDANGGSLAAEERLKAINHAYTVLKTFLR